MFRFIFILAVCSIAVKGVCETDYYDHKLRDCSSMLMLRTSTQFNNLGSQEKEAVCSIYRQGLACALDLINECADSPQLMYRGYTMEALRTRLETYRDNVNTKCA
ncbi:uncharacterized protein LOC121390536 isoform X2 [Gigantopelta aegis]|uniref:uncharacterized protein LOC121390536 isoform X2 n=1 Tax=Gigantopelta aegis TaxID=1735272 RepID=UPI001B8894E5|nr:uncharacterized protein LOC121390536 isoform X2 [Gigantopelta aegis]